MPGTDETAERIANAVKDGRSGALLLQNHGLVTLGRNFREAINISEEVDEAARIFVLTGGKAQAIPSGDIEKIKGIG